MDERVDVARDEEHRVHRCELVPRQPVVVPARPELRPYRRDRPLTRVVDLREGPPLRSLVARCVNDHPARIELRLRGTAELVGPERGEEVRLVCQQRELDRGDAASATRLLPVVDRVRDLTG